MPNPVVHWEIAAKDAKMLQGFYAALFDWHVDANNPMDYGLVDTHTEGGINGGIHGNENPAKVMIYIQVNDLDEYLRKAESLGGKTVMPPTEIPNIVTMAQFTDPEGTPDRPHQGRLGSVSVLGGPFDLTAHAREGPPLADAAGPILTSTASSALL